MINWNAIWSESWIVLPPPSMNLILLLERDCTAVTIVRGWKCDETIESSSHHLLRICVTFHICSGSEWNGIKWCFVVHDEAVVTETWNPGGYVNWSRLLCLLSTYFSTAFASPFVSDLSTAKMSSAGAFSTTYKRNSGWQLDWILQTQPVFRVIRMDLAHF
jgi:hypothetical protein